jgi:probable F420-dependent oxidoreductase
MLSYQGYELGQFGVWAPGATSTPELARHLEQIGFGALWIGGSPGGELDVVEQLLDATSTLTLATGIVNIWADDAAPIAAAFDRITGRFPGRFLLGIGVGHPEAIGRDYSRPYAALTSYLSELDEAGVPRSSIALAALGPKVLALAGARTAGAHPYLTTPTHTASARDILGPDALLAPEQRVVLEADPDAARAIGRPSLKMYLGLSNYVNNWRRLGFSEDDFADGGSDALVDALVVYGSDDVVAARLRAHLDAGADHVAVQLLSAPGQDEAQLYRQLGTALGLS